LLHALKVSPLLQPRNLNRRLAASRIDHGAHHEGRELGPAIRIDHRLNAAMLTDVSYLRAAGHSPDGSGNAPIDCLPELNIQTSEDAQKQVASYVNKIRAGVQDAFRAASQEFDAKFGPGSSAYGTDAMLVLALRPCVADACSFVQLARPDTKNRFAALYDWATSNGLTGPNRAHFMNSGGSLEAVVVAHNATQHWQDNFSESELRNAFAKTVKKAREAKLLLSYSVAALAGLFPMNRGGESNAFNSTALRAQKTRLYVLFATIFHRTSGSLSVAPVG
jgi:hypothetical protein